MKKIIMSLIFILFLVPTVVFADTNCIVVNNDKLEVGTEVSCGSEHFYVLSSDDKEVRMLAKYNLDAGKDIYSEPLVRPEGDTYSSDNYLCIVQAESNGGSSIYNDYYKRDGYCAFSLSHKSYPTKQNTNSYNLVFNQDNKLDFPVMSAYFMFKGYSNTDTNPEAYTKDNSITYNDSRFIDYLPIPSGYFRRDLPKILTEYKKRLESNSFRINKIELLSLKDIEELIINVNNDTLDYSSLGNSILENTNVDSYSFLDLKNILPDEYSWLYSDSSWYKTSYAESGYGPGVNNTSNWGYIFNTTDGKIHVSYFSGENTRIGSGIRPLITVPKQNVILKNNLGVTIESIDYVKRSNNTRVNGDPTTDGKKINLDLVFFEVGDYAEYEIVARNDTNKGLYINSDYITQNKMNNIKYEFDSNYIKAGEKKTIKLKVTYSSLVSESKFDNGIFDASTDGPLVFSNQLLKMPNALKNIGIFGIVLLIITVIAIVIGIVIIINNRKITKISMLLLTFAAIVIPQEVIAYIRVDIPVNSKIEIRKSKTKNCIFDGEIVQGAEFVEGQYTYRYKQEGNYNNWQNMDEDGWGVILTDKNSTDPVDTELCTSINDIPIVSMRTMFSYTKTSSINLSSFDTSNVTNMYSMFYNMYGSVKKLDIGYFDTSKVTNMSYMFYNNVNLEYIIDLDNWNTSKVTNMSNMFQNNRKMRNIKITKWDYSNVENMSNMFENLGYDSSKLNFEIKNIIIPKVTTLNSFAPYVGYSSLYLNIDVDNIVALNATEVNNIFYYNGYSSIFSNLKYNNVDIRNATKVDSPFYSIVNSAYESDLSITNINMEKNVNGSNIFTYIGSNGTHRLNLNIDNINLSSFTKPNYVFSHIEYSGYDADVKINNINLNSLPNLYEMFGFVGENVKNEFKIEITNIKAQNAVHADNTFLYCGQSTQKTTILVKNWDTPNLTDASYMFNHIGQSAKQLLDITIDNLNISNVTTLEGMFFSVGESNLGKVKLKFVNFDTSKVTNMSYMFKYFAGSSKEVILDGIKDFNYSSVTSVSSMFCYAIRNSQILVDLGTIDLHGASMDSMIYDGKPVKAVINLHAKPTSAYYSFRNVAKLEGAQITINYVSEVDNIDEIIGYKEDGDNVVKGVLLED